MADPLPGRSWKGWSLLTLMIALLVAVPLWAGVPAQATATRSPGPAQEPVTKIIVDTSADLNPGSNTQTCTYSSGAIFVPATDGCTLRRAIREAAARPPADRPIAIVFDLANDDPNANLEVNGTWTLPITAALPPLRTASILNINGQVTIDGATQPAGAATARRSSSTPMM